MATINFLGFIPVDMLKKSGVVFDYAIPAEWAAHVKQTIGARYIGIPDNADLNVASHFVWIYPPHGGMMGGAMPVDFTGAMILQAYSEA